MKLFLQYKKNDTGKGKFTGRLVPELETLGGDVRYEGAGCDITLSYTKFREKSGGMPRVLRVDGVHLLENKKTGGAITRSPKA